MDHRCKAHPALPFQLQLKTIPSEVIIHAERRCKRGYIRRAGLGLVAATSYIESSHFLHPPSYWTSTDAPYPVMFPKASVLALAVIATTAVGVPVLIDKGLMQLALTIEHLENAFYSGGMARFAADDFERVGYPPWVRARFHQMADIEATHVTVLSNVLGDDAPAPCKYNFMYDDVHTFINIAQALEIISAGAYLGAARHISNGGTLNTGVSIAATESRQAGWITSVVLKEQPWDGAFATDIPPSPAYSLIHSNPTLPLTVLPTLKVSQPMPKAGQTITLSYDSSNSPNSTLYAAWANGVNVTYTEMMDEQTIVPAGLLGTTFVGVVSNQTKPGPRQADFVSGWAVVQFPFDSTMRLDSWK
ncbi:hypothetical protein BN946_scf184993.g24 [Trametes cinnabarina]|uniref:Uncharacterized protein n=1 Tax=Pycnoporus cinnabarinus TaxID=5643 RepID=A0A060SUF2_PYCCI|nr:hypothetical protein BN946_scf184993.g24 [Trametes cinnabarina]